VPHVRIWPGGDGQNHRPYRDLSFGSVLGFKGLVSYTPIAELRLALLWQISSEKAVCGNSDIALMWIVRARLGSPGGRPEALAVAAGLGFFFPLPPLRSGGMAVGRHDLRVKSCSVQSLAQFQHSVRPRRHNPIALALKRALAHVATA
jgi:hypothetical protein